LVASEDRKVKRRVEKIRAGVVTYYDGTELRECAVESWQRWCRDRVARVVKKAA
jgi:hypothetical protein